MKRLSPPPLPPGALSPSSPRVRRWLERLRPPRKLKLTRDGKYFIGITFGVGFVAVATANNLLYLMLGMLLSLIIVSGVLSEMSLRHLRVTRRLPVRAQVGRAHLVEIEVHNDKRRLPSYAIEVEDLRAGQPADKRCFFLKVSPRSTQVAAYRRTPARRGVDQHVGFRIATRFPFGFFEKSRELRWDGELIIYPGVDPVRLPEASGGDRLGAGTAQGRGFGDDIIGIRPMREGDDPRDIYWRKSVTGMVVLERAREARRNVRLDLDNQFEGASASPQWDESFERSIRRCASLAVAHLRRGETVRLSTTHGERVVASPSTGADPVLRFLALLEAYTVAPAPAGPTSARDAVAASPSAVPGGETSEERA